MEEKKIETIYVLRFVLRGVERTSRRGGGKNGEKICRFMFTNEEISEPQDDRENFFWSNIKDVLEEVKRIEERGRNPKNLNEKMPHFTFTDTYGKALKLMTDAESGQYIKAICEYMFFGTERKLKPPADMYFSFAKKKLELSRKRKSSGSKGGKQARVKVSDKEIAKIIAENSKYGNNFVNELSKSLKLEFQESDGYSPRNLARMRKFYETYKSFAILPPPVAKLPWTHNFILIEKVKDFDVRMWYAQKCVENGWGKVVLEHQI